MRTGGGGGGGGGGVEYSKQISLHKVYISSLILSHNDLMEILLILQSQRLNIPFCLLFSTTSFYSYTISFCCLLKYKIRSVII